MEPELILSLHDLPVNAPSHAMFSMLVELPWIEMVETQ